MSFVGVIVVLLPSWILRYQKQSTKIKFWMTSRFILKQLDYSLSISMLVVDLGCFLLCYVVEIWVHNLIAHYKFHKMLLHVNIKAIQKQKLHDACKVQCMFDVSGEKSALCFNFFIICINQPSVLTCRYSSWSTATHFCGQATGRWQNTFWLQHTERQAMIISYPNLII